MVSSTPTSWPAISPSHVLRVSGLLVLTMLFLPLGQAQAQDWEDTEPAWQDELLKRSNQAIERATAYLLSRQGPDGSWEEGGSHPGGRTALVTLALLSAGVSHQSPEMIRAITYLQQVEANTTYAVALRAGVWSMIPSPTARQHLRRDLRWLLDAVISRGPNRGMYTYGPPAGDTQAGDFSNSQYGVLGVWYASLAGLEVPQGYWRNVENAWLENQRSDGGWGYVPGPGTSYSSMTAAGLATLWITYDQLHAHSAQNLLRLPPTRAIDRAASWLGGNFAVDRNIGLDAPGAPNPSFLHYMLFSFERIGEASGQTRFGEHPWYELGARHLLATQRDDGSWESSLGPVIDTAFSVLFLSRGRAPVIIQKLQFEGRWNNRSRDLAGFVRFMRRATERHVNWQIVSIDASEQELGDAPLLYVASDRPVSFTDAQVDRLRRYLDQGGLLIAVAEGNTPLFARSIEALCQRLYPHLPLRELPADHPVHTANFPAGHLQIPVKGVSNGVRELIVLFPSGDMTWRWQSAQGGFEPKLTPYAPLANLLLYATNAANPRFKGERHWVGRDPDVEHRAELSVTRLRYEGPWNPEPAAWERLANLLHNRGIKLDVQTRPADALIGSRVVHLTASEAFDLPAEDREHLRRYLSEGGVLLFDAAGGSSAALVSFETLMADLLPGVRPTMLPPDHPLYRQANRGGHDIDSVRYRRGDPRLTPIRAPRLLVYQQDNRIVAISSPEDLTAGLAGLPHAGIRGYTPASAAKIVENLLVWRQEN